MPEIAGEFLGYANEESAHADRLAQRIVELGGEPDFSPDSLTERSYVAYDDSSDLQAMIRANLIAERGRSRTRLFATAHRHGSTPSRRSAKSALRLLALISNVSEGEALWGFPARYRRSTGHPPGPTHT
jgi:bacterioferritin (cytochrome b1)